MPPRHYETKAFRIETAGPAPGEPVSASLAQANIIASADEIGSAKDMCSPNTIENINRGGLINPIISAAIV
jgi:hypothetical protein